MNDGTAPLAAPALERIRRKKDEFSAKQRIFAEFVVRQPERLGFLSIMEAAGEAGVSQTTIFRFCKELGYNGYAQFTREIQQALQEKMSVSKTFQLAMDHYKDKDKPQSVFESVIRQSIEDISSLSESIRKDDYYRCIDLLCAADRVVVVGAMASAPLAQHLGNLFIKLGMETAVVCGHGVPTTAALDRLTEKSVVVLLAFPRYPRATVEIGAMAARSKARVIGITNTLSSPIVPFAHIAFIVPLTFRSFADPFTAPMTLLTALVTELSSRLEKRAEIGLKRYDEYVSEFNLFE